MDQDTIDKITKDLKVLDKLNKKFPALSEEVIYKEICRSRKNNELENYFFQGFNFAVQSGIPIQDVTLGDIYNLFSGNTTEEIPFFDIEVEPEEPISLKSFIDNGDIVDLKIGKERFTAKVVDNGQNEDELFTAKIDCEMLFTEVHEAKEGDYVKFKRNHIFKHTPTI